MHKYTLILLLCMFLCPQLSFSATRNSYTQYGKHLMPTYYDPYYIRDFENCTPNFYVDWTGTYRYVIEGFANDKKGKVCKYKTQYNPWLKINKNEWEDYKTCDFNDIQRNELTVALKEHSNRISSYNLGAYKTTGTKLEYLLYDYEYHGTCKLIWKRGKGG